MPGFSRFANREPRNASDGAPIDSGNTVTNAHNPTAQDESEWGDGFEQQDYHGDDYSHGNSDGESFSSDNGNYMYDDMSYGTEESYGGGSFGGSSFDEGGGFGDEVMTNEQHASFSAVELNKTNVHLESSRFGIENNTPSTKSNANVEITKNGSNKDKSKTNSVAVTPNYGKNKVIASQKAPSIQNYNSNQMSNHMTNMPPTLTSFASLSFPGRVIPLPPTNLARATSRRVSFGEELSPPPERPILQAKQVTQENDKNQRMQLDQTECGRTDTTAFVPQSSRKNVDDSRSTPPKSILKVKKKTAPFRQPKAKLTEQSFRRLNPYANVTENISRRKKFHGVTAVTPSRHAAFEDDGNGNAKENQLLVVNPKSIEEPAIAFENNPPTGSRKPVSENTSRQDGKMTFDDYDLDDFESNQARFLKTIRETEDLQEQIDSELLDMNNHFSESFALLLCDLETAVDLMDKLETIDNLAEETLLDTYQQPDDDKVY